MPLGKIGRPLGNSNLLGDTGVRINIQYLLYSYSRIMNIDIPTISLEANSRLRKISSVQIGAISRLLKIIPVTVLSTTRLQDTFITTPLLGRSRLEAVFSNAIISRANLYGKTRQHTLSTSRLTVLDIQNTLEAIMRLRKVQQPVINGMAYVIRYSQLSELIVTHMESNFFMTKLRRRVIN